MTTFDPAAWLAKAEAGGYEVRFTLHQPGIYFREPRPRILSDDEEIALWREYRPDDVAAELNSRALADELKATGKVENWRNQEGGAL